MTRTPFAAGLLTATALSFAPLTASAAPAPAALAPTAVDTFIGPILANATDPATLNKRCDQYVAEVDRRIAELASETGPATVARTLQRYDDLSALLIAAGGEFTLYRQVMASDALRNAASAGEARIAAESNKIGVSRPIYDRLKAIPVAGLDAPTALYLTRTLGGFERAGVSLPPAQRDQAQKLSDEIATLGIQFDKAIADGRKTIEADLAELDGLPVDFIAAHKPGPDGKITLGTDYTDYFPVMTYAKSSELHHRFSIAYNTRAYPGNDATLRAMLDKRQQFATLLGRKDHASLVLEDKMLDTPAKVEALMADMNGALRPAAQRDFARKLAVYQSTHPGATTYPSWDNSWLSNQVQVRDFAYDSQAARQYFAYDNVRDGILRLTETLFGVTIRPWQTAKWDPLVETYEIVDQGRVIGRFYFDSHPRPGKYQHANAIGLRPGVAGRAIPVGVLVMNLPAGGHTTGLMEHQDVETFLHEFGHLLHGIFGGQTPRWAGQSGVATEWDFVEAPSQMLEEWVYDYDTLKNFAVNAKGEPIPRDLVEKMNRARYFDVGMGDLRQLGLTSVSLRLHEGPAPADLGSRTRELLQQYDLLQEPPYLQMQDGFGHLNGYSAIYYTYRWSKVIADDMFTRFKANGLRDPATAARYRQMVLAPGGTKPAAVLVQDFLGRPISIQAYKADVAKDQ
jgi:thimet oligopeptidase